MNASITGRPFRTRKRRLLSVSRWSAAASGRWSVHVYPRVLWRRQWRPWQLAHPRPRKASPPKSTLMVPGWHLDKGKREKVQQTCRQPFTSHPGSQSAASEPDISSARHFIQLINPLAGWPATQREEEEREEGSSDRTDYYCLVPPFSEANHANSRLNRLRTFLPKQTCDTSVLGPTELYFYLRCILLWTLASTQRKNSLFSVQQNTLDCGQRESDLLQLFMLGQTAAEITLAVRLAPAGNLPIKTTAVQFFLLRLDCTRSQDCLHVVSRLTPVMLDR